MPPESRKRFAPESPQHHFLARRMVETVDQILLRFPGPVTFQASRVKWLFLLLGGLFFVAVAVVWTPRRPGIISTALYSSPMRWVLIVSCGLAILISLVGILSKASKLNLSSKGFQFGLPSLPVSVSWTDAANFRAARSGGNNILGFHFGGAKVVEFDYVGQNTCGTLFDTYGFSNGDLARLMNAWRERALL